jgi:hypothetical protein
MVSLVLRAIDLVDGHDSREVCKDRGTFLLTFRLQLCNVKEKGMHQNRCQQMLLMYEACIPSLTSIPPTISILPTPSSRIYDGLTINSTPTSKTDNQRKISRTLQYEFQGPDKFGAGVVQPCFPYHMRKIKNLDRYIRLSGPRSICPKI